MTTALIKSHSRRNSAFSISGRVNRKTWASGWLMARLAALEFPPPALLTKRLLKARDRVSTVYLV